MNKISESSLRLKLRLQQNRVVDGEGMGRLAAEKDKQHI